jgi:hypothetical protein
METTMDVTPLDTQQDSSCEGLSVGGAIAGALINGVVVAGAYVCVRGVVRGWARYQIRRENRRVKQEN